jgi:uncharacterized protein
VSASFHFACVTAFDRGLGGLSQVLKRAETVGGIDIADTRLAPDMYPLSEQVVIACDFARNTSARVLGLAVQPPGSVASFTEAQQLIADAKAFLATLKADAFEGLETKSVTFPVGLDERTATALQYVLGFAAPTFHFHNVMAYAIVRNQGGALTKRDYFGVPG